MKKKLPFGHNLTDALELNFGSPLSSTTTVKSIGLLALKGSVANKRPNLSIVILLFELFSNE